MADPRTTPNPDLVTVNTPARVMMPVADLNRQAGHKRDRQVLLGERVTILGRIDNHCYVVTDKDNYVGYIARSALTEDSTMTHRINALATHSYTEPDMKSADRLSLSHGSLISVTELTEKFAKTDFGYIPKQHICPIDQNSKDPVEVAKMFLGTPYLWGGNSNNGIDCSGLVQAALTACGIPCPGDSDQQETQLGRALDHGAPIEKGDLLFWKGHIAMAADDKTLIHANAHHMACAYEPIKDAIKRIADQGDGNVTAHKRL
jgi:cell wall-associated NlpC family hydrolase